MTFNGFKVRAEMNAARITVYEVSYGESCDHTASQIIIGNYETLKVFRQQWRHVDVVKTTEIEVHKDIHGDLSFNVIGEQNGILCSRP